MPLSALTINPDRENFAGLMKVARLLRDAAIEWINHSGGT
jgi:hypothetical protein